jgi:bifunctional non-homologous end joining protein LigD
VFENGEALLETAKQKAMEGIVCKRADSVYAEGKRPDTWLKLKIRMEQEFVVLGWTEGKNGFAGTVGALILGVYDGDDLVFCGKAGTGLGSYDRDRMYAELGQAQVVDRSQYVGVPPDKEYREAHWIEPTLVVQVAFQRWTRDGRLWHPSIQYQRDDKDPREVVRET